MRLLEVSVRWEVGKKRRRGAAARMTKMFVATLFFAVALAMPANVVERALAGRSGALVLVDCGTGEVYRNDARASAEKAPPCSTFKIWNTAIGLETREVADADGLFWKWDGKKRFLEAWSADQTLRTAFATSCVPAYQALARKIGGERMQAWLDKVGYGDRNISSGIDVFWLPGKGRRTILISAEEQAELMANLVKGKTPFSARTLGVLKDVMMAKRTERGVLYGKTGTGTDPETGLNWGWYVGYVEGGGRTRAFACLLKAKGVMGKDAREVVEEIFEARGWL